MSAPTSKSPDGLNRAQNDASANFWFDDVGKSKSACGGMAPPTVVSPDKKSWVEIALADKNGNPVPDEGYEITLPDGSVVGGNLNKKGRARIEGIDPGNCKVAFPKLDKHSWKPK